MENAWRLPSRKPQSLSVRLALTTAMVAVCFAVLLGLQRADGLLGFYVLLPAIFAAAILFDRSAGIYATGLSTIFLYVLLTPYGSALLPRQYVLPLSLYVLVALGFTIASDALRRAWERAAAAEQAKDLLLRELGHRTKNNLAMAISMLSMQASLKSNVETRRALEKAAARLYAIASAHEHFRPFEHKGRIEMRAYLGQLCGHLGDALRDVRPIAVKVDACELHLPAEQAVALGLIVNELVTNSLKHAFPSDRAGTIHVILRSQSGVTLLVRDDGIGCSTPTGGIGTRLVMLLAQQLGARVGWGQVEPGCEVRVDLPLPNATRPGAHTEAMQLRPSEPSGTRASL
jgi:two-component system, sensor histidine kinase PdtaS